MTKRVEMESREISARNYVEKKKSNSNSFLGKMALPDLEKPRCRTIENSKSVTSSPVAKSIIVHGENRRVL